MYVFLSTTETNVSTAKLQDYLTAVHSWFTNHGLMINLDKSEATVFSTTQRAGSTSASLTHVDVAGAAIALTDNLKILGVIFDDRLSLNTYVHTIYKSAIYQIRALHYIRSTVTLDMAT